MPHYAVTLLSGGLDSTTVAAYAKERAENGTTLTFDYGQSHSTEVVCAARVSEILGMTHQLLDISFLSNLAWYSALTNPSDFPVPSNRRAQDIGHGVPITYVPMRNAIFLSLATAFLENRVLHAIEVDGIDASDVSASVYMAPNALDYSGYPDCRPEFYDAMRTAVMLGSKLWADYAVTIKVETPIIDLSKAEIIALALKLGAPLEHTWSCYQGGPMPCGSCDSCILRAKGFSEVGIADPLLTRLGGI